MDFSARLLPETYADDEPVGFAAVEASSLPGPVPDAHWSYVPEPLWQRVLSLGNAYRLHFAQVVEPVIDTVLDSSQCQSLCIELEFLSGIVTDPAAAGAFAVLLEHAHRVSRQPSLRLIISPP